LVIAVLALQATVLLRRARIIDVLQKGIPGSVRPGEWSGTRKLQAQRSAIDGGYAGLEVGGQKTSVNAQNRPGLDHRGKNETAAHPPRARSKRSPVRLPLAA
jgi:hypothetical protein